MLKKKDQKGQSLVEVAITLPILLLIVMGILDLGRAYYTYVALSDAAAEGAAYAAIDPNDTAQAIERAADSTDGAVQLTPEMINVIVADTSPGSPITVTVNFDYQLLTPFINAMVPEGHIALQATAVQPIMGQ